MGLLNTIPRLSWALSLTLASTGVCVSGWAAGLGVPSSQLLTGQDEGLGLTRLPSPPVPGKCWNGWRGQSWPWAHPSFLGFLLWGVLVQNRSFWTLQSITGTVCCQLLLCSRAKELGSSRGFGKDQKLHCRVLSSVQDAVSALRQGRCWGCSRKGWEGWEHPGTLGVSLPKQDELQAPSKPFWDAIIPAIIPSVELDLGELGEKIHECKDQMWVLWNSVTYHCQGDLEGSVKSFLESSAGDTRMVVSSFGYGSF